MLLNYTPTGLLKKFNYMIDGEDYTVFDLIEMAKKDLNQIPFLDCKLGKDPFLARQLLRLGILSAHDIWEKGLIYEPEIFHCAVEEKIILNIREFYNQYYGQSFSVWAPLVRARKLPLMPSMFHSGRDFEILMELYDQKVFHRQEILRLKSEVVQIGLLNLKKARVNELLGLTEGERENLENVQFFVDHKILVSSFQEMYCKEENLKLLLNYNRANFNKIPAELSSFAIESFYSHSQPFSLLPESLKETEEAVEIYLSKFSDIYEQLSLKQKKKYSMLAELLGLKEAERVFESTSEDFSLILRAFSTFEKTGQYKSMAQMIEALYMYNSNLLQSNEIVSIISERTKELSPYLKDLFVMQAGYLYRHAPKKDTLLSNRATSTFAAKSSQFFEHYLDACHGNIESIKNYVKVYPNTFLLLPSHLKRDRVFVQELLEQDFKNIQYFDSEVIHWIISEKTDIPCDELKEVFEKDPKDYGKNGSFNFFYLLYRDDERKSNAISNAINRYSHQNLEKICWNNKKVQSYAQILELDPKIFEGINLFTLFNTSPDLENFIRCSFPSYQSHCEEVKIEPKLLELLKNSLASEKEINKVYKNMQLSDTTILSLRELLVASSPDAPEIVTLDCFLKEKREEEKDIYIDVSVNCRRLLMNNENVAITKVKLVKETMESRMLASEEKNSLLVMLGKEHEALLPISTMLTFLREAEARNCCITSLFEEHNMNRSTWSILYRNTKKKYPGFCKVAFSSFFTSEKSSMKTIQEIGEKVLELEISSISEFRQVFPDWNPNLLCSAVKGTFIEPQLSTLVKSWQKPKLNVISVPSSISSTLQKVPLEFQIKEATAIESGTYKKIR